MRINGGRSDVQPKSAVLYRGTKCNRGFMNKAREILREVQQSWVKIDSRCWIQTGLKTAPHFHTKFSIAYLDVKHYNIKKGKFDLAAGHSAGGFPAAFTDAKIKIGFNPFFTQYPLLDVIFHARDDFLVLVNKPRIIKAQKLILYDGGHSDFPKKEFKKWLLETF